MTTEELIPCPFCGITPEDTGKIIICRVQTCPIQGHKIDRDSWQLRPYVEDLIAERDAFESAHEGALEDIKIIERAHASQSVGGEELAKEVHHYVMQMSGHTDPSWESATPKFREGLIRLLAPSRPTNVSDNPPENCKLVAVHDGDGWAFEVVDAQEEVVALLGWPQRFGSSMTATDLKREGFEIG